MINHHISDLVARLKNAATNQKNKNIPFKVFKTKDNLAILNILHSLGFISWSSPWSANAEAGHENTASNSVYWWISLNNLESSRLDISAAASLKNIQVISRPGRRVYFKVQDIKTQKQGMVWYIIRTSQGIMTHYEALEKGLGGEALLKVQ